MMDSTMRPSEVGRAWIEIDFDALTHNAEAVRSCLPDGCELMAVVKSDAYGHGMVKCAMRLRSEGVREFLVATVVEGIRLRKAASDIDILVMGHTHPKEAQFLHEYSLSQVVVDGNHAVQLDEMGIKLRVHIEVDTGMHRLGFMPRNLAEIESVFKCKNLIVDGVATHLAAPDSCEKDDIEFTRAQIDEFYFVVESLKSKGYDVGKLHIQASYGILNLPDLRCDYARAGIALYGAMGKDSELLSKAVLHPVLSLRARIAQVRLIEAGESVSYGRTFRAEKPTKIATINIGYADGVPRQMSGNGGMCLISGKKAPIIGRICMDMLMADVTGVDEVRAGDIATLIGAEGDEFISCEDFAAASGTIPNDILCRLGGRLPRIYKG